MASGEQCEGTLNQNIESQGKQAKRSDPRGAPLGVFDGLVRPTAPLHEQTPQQYPSSQELDKTIQPKAFQGHASGGKSRRQGNHRLNDHPGDGEDFDAHTSLDEPRPLKSWWGASTESAILTSYDSCLVTSTADTSRPSTIRSW